MKPHKARSYRCSRRGARSRPVRRSRQSARATADRARACGRPRGDRGADRRQRACGARLRAALHAMDRSQGRRHAMLRGAQRSGAARPSSSHARARNSTVEWRSAPSARPASRTGDRILVQAPDERGRPPAAAGLAESAPRTNGWRRAAAAGGGTEVFGRAGVRFAASAPVGGAVRPAAR